MKLALGLGLHKNRLISDLIFLLLSSLRARSTYFENEEETKVILNNLKKLQTSSAFGLLNTLEARSTYFENRAKTRQILISIENCN